MSAINKSQVQLNLSLINQQFPKPCGIAVLLIAVAENPVSALLNQDVTIIKNPGKADMSMLIKEGETLKEYQASGKIGEGQGAKAGTAYRMKNGTMVYVPEK